MNQNPSDSTVEPSPEYRQKVMGKIRKLMTLALDGRGNEQEAETALRQAQLLMAKFNIDEADVIAKELQDKRAEVIIERWKRAGMNIKPGGTKQREFPDWASVLGLGVGRFCDCRVVIRKNIDGVPCAVFAGYNADAEMASWTFDYLMDCIKRRSRAFNVAIDEFKRTRDPKPLEEFGLGYSEGLSLLAHSPKGRMDTFRVFMASQLQRRMKEMKAKWQEEQVKDSKALMVLDAKMVALRDLFGDFNTGKPLSYKMKGDAAAYAGQREGDRTRLQPNPLGNDASASPPPPLLRGPRG